MPVPLGSDEVETIWRKKIEGHYKQIFKGRLYFEVECAKRPKFVFDDTLPNVKKRREEVFAEET